MRIELCYFFICFLLYFALIFKIIRVISPSTLGYLVINLHSFIQFFWWDYLGITTKSVILHADPSGLGSCFFDLFVKKNFLQFSPSLFYLLKIELIFFILIFMRLSHSHLIFSLLLDKILQCLIFFLKTNFFILISWFNVLLIKYWSSYFFLVFFLWGYLNVIPMITRLAGLPGLTRNIFFLVFF